MEIIEAGEHLLLHISGAAPKKVIDLNMAWKSGLRRTPVRLFRPNPYYRKVVNMLLGLQVNILESSSTVSLTLYWFLFTFSGIGVFTVFAAASGAGVSGVSVVGSAVCCDLCFTSLDFRGHLGGYLRLMV